MARERRRRQYGTGSVYRRKTDGRWLGTIEAGYTRTGARRRITVVGDTEAEAKARLKTRARELARGDQAPASRTTVKAWAATWLEMTSHTARPKSHTTDRGAVKAWIVPTIGRRRLDQLTPADIRAVDTAITAAGNSTTTARRYRGTLHRMLRAAIDEGHPVPPRVLTVRAPATAVHDRQAIPTRDAVAILRVAAGLPHGSRWVAALLQGMRQGECLGMTWAELDEETATVSWQLQALPYRIPRDRTSGFRIPDGYEARRLEHSLHLVRPKSQAGWRVIPLVPWMADALRAWRDNAPTSPYGLVWPEPDGSPRRERADRAEWEALQATAGVRHPAGRPYTLHEARHATATLLMELRVPETVRIAIMGHSTIASTHGYEHADVTMAREALTQVARRLELG